MHLSLGKQVDLEKGREKLDRAGKRIVPVKERQARWPKGREKLDRGGKEIASVKKVKAR